MIVGNGANKITRAREIASEIRILIESRGLKEGEKLLTEKELCKEFSVGRSTIREALRILETTHIVVLKPGRGAFVASKADIDAEKLQFQGFESATLIDYCEIRLALEPLSIRLAVHRASPEEIAEIAHAESFFIQASMKKDAFLMAKYDELYHKMIVQATHNPLLINLSELVQNAVYDMRLQSFVSKDSPLNTIEPHEEILQAIYEHNEEKAVAAMSRHIQMFLDEVKSKEDKEKNGTH